MSGEPVNYAELALAYVARRNDARAALRALAMPSIVRVDPREPPRCGLGECYRCGEYTTLGRMPPLIAGTPEGWYCRGCLASDLAELRRELARILRRREARA